MSGSLGTQSTGGALPQATPEDTSVSRMSATPGNAVEVELIGFAVGNDDTDIPVFRTPGPPGTTSAPSEPQAGIPATLGGKPAILILPTTSDASTGGRSISQSGTNLTQQASFQQPGGTASGPSTSSSVSTSQTPLPPGNVRGAAGLGASTPSTTNLLQASSKNSTVDPGASSSSGVSGVAQAFPGVLPGSVMHQALQRSGLLSQPPPSERPAASKRRRKRRGGEGDLASQGVGRTGVNQPVAVDPYDNTPSPKLRFSPLRTAEGAAGATKPPHLLASLPSSDPGMFSSTGSSPTGSSRLPSPQGSSSSTSLSLGTAHRNSQTTFPLKREPLPPGTLVEPVVPLVPFAANKNGRLETVIIPSAAVVATGGSSFPQSGTDATQQNLPSAEAHVESPRRFRTFSSSHKGMLCINHYSSSHKGLLCINHYSSSHKGLLCINHYSSSHKGLLCINHYSCSHKGLLCINHYSSRHKGLLCINHYRCSHKGMLCINHYSSSSNRGLLCTIDHSISHKGMLCINHYSSSSNRGLLCTIDHSISHKGMLCTNHYSSSHKGLLCINHYSSSHRGLLCTIDHSISHKGLLCINHYSSSHRGLLCTIDHSISHKGMLCINHYSSSHRGLLCTIDHSISHKGMLCINHYSSSSNRGLLCTIDHSISDKGMLCINHYSSSHKGMLCINHYSSSHKGLLCINHYSISHKGLLCTIDHSIRHKGLLCINHYSSRSCCHLGCSRKLRCRGSLRWLQLTKANNVHLVKCL
ncbi:putative omega secalin [Toxoplasma gondii]|uniref:Putative omega secalin n=1 Tax=Toxoplasma gondii TaxID=5811 RepID=A0A7J6K534_TOXGO|nr:putative omega secalin [Toxoplasma gondii]